MDYPDRNKAVYNRLRLTTIALFVLLPFLSPLVAISMQFSGFVVDSNGQPVDQAMVRLQGTSLLTLSNQVGHYQFNINEAITSKYITAWKIGYYNGGSLFGEGEASTIVLKPIQKEDNADYDWLPSSKAISIEGRQEIKPCRHCHAEITEQWGKSTHGTSATNPIFLAFFRGTDKYGKKGSGTGYKIDFPNSNGNCASCHVPVMAMKNPFNSDPNEARGAASEGVSCDFCHKISDVRIDNTGGYPGTMSLRLNRPSRGEQLFFGPYDDVFPGDDSYHPLYKDSSYCAPCHNGKFWDVEVYSEYKEWAESPYAAKSIHCQKCHMAPVGAMTRFAPTQEGSIERRPEAIASHLFNGVSDQSFMKEAIGLGIQSELKGDQLTVVATVTNHKAGHHYPTGNPMRNMILLVYAAGEGNRMLPLVDGERVPVWGGVGAGADGNYAGLPGKGFAKVLKESVPYPGSPDPRHFQPQYPAPHWRPSRVESDNRIPAYGKDISKYRYRVPTELRGPIKIKARLLFRKAYKNWMDAKGFAGNDMELAQKDLLVGR